MNWRIHPIEPFRYIENGSILSTLKAFGHLPEKLVASYTRKILCGLAYLHEHEVRLAKRLSFWRARPE